MKRGVLAAWILGQRKLHGWTLREMSAATGLYFTYIAKLEDGVVVNPSLDVIYKLAAGLGYKPSAIVGVLEEPFLRKQWPHLHRAEARAASQSTGGAR